MMIGCSALAQLLLQVHEDAESDSRAQRGEKGYGEPHKRKQCVFHRSFLSQAERAFRRQYDYRTIWGLGQEGITPGIGIWAGRPAKLR